MRIPSNNANRQEFERDTLLARILNSWGSVQKPAYTELIRGGEGLGEGIDQTLQSRHWRELNLDFLSDNHELIFFLTPVAYHYFLPAYLWASVKDYGKAGQIPYSLMTTLTEPDKEDSKVVYFARMRLLDHEQAKVVQDALEYLTRTYPEMDVCGFASRAVRDLTLTCFQKQ
jgi:hypothetical protein